MLVGLIADTHIPHRRKVMPRQVFDIFERVDLILHAGDISSIEVLQELELMAPVLAVHGNADPPELANILPSERVIELAGYKVGLTHGHLGRGKTTPERALDAFAETHVIVFGHSHIPLIERRCEVLLINPGSATDRRRQAQYSVGFLRLGDGVEGRIVYF